jgi:signal transduction histidine kinase
MDHVLTDRKREALRADAPTRPIPREAADAKLFAVMRVVLAVTGLAITHIDPIEPRSGDAVAYAFLGLYCACAAGIVLMEAKTGWKTDQRLLCASDIAFASVLRLWTQGAQSIFFYALLFPILVVSFSHGYRDGLLFTLASVAALIVVGALSDPPILYHELDTALIRRPLYLLAFGYMVAKWVGREILLKRRLMLLREINTTSARVAVDRLVELNLRRIIAFHRAERAVLVIHSPGERRYTIYSSAESEKHASGAREMSEASAQRLLRFGEHACILYSARRLPGLAPRCTNLTVERKGERQSAVAVSDCEAVARLLEARHFVTVPYRQGGTAGLLFLTARRRFSPDDVDFLVQFSDAVAKVVENLQLVDELISSAAEHERLMISRDIHDAAVQPYIGLRLALEALYRQSAGSALAPRILDLVEMASATVRDLRGFTRGLLAGGDIPGESLHEAVLMQADRYGRFYGLRIATRLDHESANLSGRFAAHVFYIVVEALTNIVKHTAARDAFVEVSVEDSCVSIRVGNEESAGEQTAGFVPKSIKSRVEALGGTFAVQHGTAGYTVVHATLPSP